MIIYAFKTPGIQDNYMISLRFILLVFIISGILTKTSLARDMTGIELKATHVNGNIYMLEGVGGFAGGNIGVSIGDDGILIVDDQFVEMSDKIKVALSELDDKGPLKFVLNTHWHGDHTGSNDVFSQKASIIAHENVRNRLMTSQNNLIGETPARPREAWPVITFNDSVNIHFNNETIKVVHHPRGHTDGDSIIYFTGSKVVHMGDHFFAGQFPFIDLDTGGNAIGYAKNIENVIRDMSDDVKIIPGHGPLSRLDDLMKFHKMITDSIYYVSKHMNKGLTLEEIQTKGLPDNLKSWDKGFIKSDAWLMIIYKSLKSEE